MLNLWPETLIPKTIVPLAMRPASLRRPPAEITPPDDTDDFGRRMWWFMFQVASKIALSALGLYRQSLETLRRSKLRCADERLRMAHRNTLFFHRQG